MASELFGDDLQKLYPIMRDGASDSAQFDNALEFLALTGRELPEAMLMMIPEAWENRPDMDPDLARFYEYHSFLMEPWDGPASIAFTDGRKIGAGARPQRPAPLALRGHQGRPRRDGFRGRRARHRARERPASRAACSPGDLLRRPRSRGASSTTSRSRQLRRRQPYREWVERTGSCSTTCRAPSLPAAARETRASRFQLQQAFGYTSEDSRS